MRIAQDSLAGALARGLRSAYLVTGAEPLLIGEACDLIRSAARNAGYAERELHFLDRGFDWNRLMTGAANLSLFGERRLIELRLSGPIDTTAARSLTELAERPPADTLLLVSGELERNSLQAAWVQAFEQAAALVLTRLMTDLLFGVPPADPVTFVAVSALLCATSLVACYVPARRALRVNPVEVLRSESPLAGPVPNRPSHAPIGLVADRTRR